MEVKLSDLMHRLTKSQLADYNIQSTGNVRELSNITGVEFQSFESFLKDYSFFKTLDSANFRDIGIRKFDPRDIGLDDVVKFSNLNETFHIQEVSGEINEVQSEVKEDE